jgi:Tyrosine phosphatase family
LADEVFLNEKCQALCQERNLPLEKIKNARDLASVRASPIQPNRVLRMGRVSDATDQDLRILFFDKDHGGRDLRTIVDLRSPTELKDDPTLMRVDVFENFTDLVWKERGNNGDGCLRELPKGSGPVIPRTEKRRKRDLFFKRRIKYVDTNTMEVELNDEDVQKTEEESNDAMVNILDEDNDCIIMKCDDATLVPASSQEEGGKRKERHFVSLMNEFKYVKGTVSKVRKRDITKSILKSPGAILSRRVRDSCKKPFLDEINGGGLTMLNELLLHYGAPGIRYVLELCADRNRHPIAFHCTAGKDRTGIIAVIILALCGVPDENIVEDYAMSANVYAEMNDHKAMVGALSQRSLDPKVFLGAHPQVMRDVLQNIRTEFGSVEGYCTWIGFGPEKQEKLKKAVIQD